MTTQAAIQTISGYLGWQTGAHGAWLARHDADDSRRRAAPRLNPNLTADWGRAPSRDAELSEVLDDVLEDARELSVGGRVVKHRGLGRALRQKRLASRA